MTGDNEDTRPHISMISDDLLWQIFTSFSLRYYHFNLVEYYLRREDKCLVTLRRVSQVCSAWRSLVLSSPSLWANALDFRSLSQEGDNWRNEVVRRTGAAPLSITNLGIRGNRADDFLWVVIESNMKRLRRVRLQAHGRSSEKLLARLTSNSLSPTLEILRIELGGINDNSPVRYQQVLLGRRVHYLHITGFHPDLSNSSFTNLRALTLEGQLHPNFISNLVRMNLLEEFTFRGPYNSDHLGPTVQCHSSGYVDPLHLPYLRVLSIQGRVRVLMALLAYLPLPSSLENFFYATMYEDLTGKELDIFQQQLSRYLQQCLGSGQGEGISIVLDWENFVIQNYPYDVHHVRFPTPKIPFSLRIFPEEDFAVNIPGYNFFIPGMLSTIIDFFTNARLCSLASITSIEVDFGWDKPSIPQALPQNVVCTWLGSLPVVHTLYTSTLELNSLMVHQKSGYLLLPALKHCICQDQRVTVCSAETIDTLARQRIELGIPLETVDLTQCIDGQLDGFLILDNVDGPDIKLNSEMREGVSRMKLLRELPGWGSLTSNP
ncbi:hypothetical protein D9613_009651 [Agrocybe pediades]|uniref:F-box domain-containing protein n=1 Tax=Agrocybe pediades TaxID=84607 RepID=A0A8H4VSN6_9AGAR|nr:hypothetical protein D9613_009651 [Agrocybe pediades]